jgi:ABC-type glycerol-3-phosphate transport system substrate-binding protein
MLDGMLEAALVRGVPTFPGTPMIKASREIDLRDPDLPQTGFDEMRLGNGLYAIPDTQAAVLIFYNRDLLPKAGLKEPAERSTGATTWSPPSR